MAERLIAHVGEISLEPGAIGDLRRQPLRQDIRQHRCNALASRLRTLAFEHLQHIHVRCEIDADGLAFAPIGRNLQDRGTRQPPVGEQDRFLERGASTGNAGLAGDTGKDTGTCKRLRSEGQRHEAGAGLRHRVIELLGDPVSETCGAHLRDRLAAAGHDKIPADKRARPTFDCDPECKTAFRLFQRFQRRVEPQFRTAALHFAQEHRDDVFRRIITEQLPQRLFMKTDAVRLDERDEVVLGITAQCGLGEMRVSRNEPAGADIQIGEIAAPAAGDADFFSRCLGVIEHENAAALRACLRRTHHSRGTGPENDGIEIGRCCFSGKHEQIPNPQRFVSPTGRRRLFGAPAEHMNAVNYA